MTLLLGLIRILIPFFRSTVIFSTFFGVQKSRHKRIRLILTDLCCSSYTGPIIPESSEGSIAKPSDRMRFFELTNVLLLAGCLSSVAAEAHEHHRVLRAATTRSKLLRRDTKIERRFETEVVYIEGAMSHFIPRCIVLTQTRRKRLEWQGDLRNVSQGRVEEANPEFGRH